jgi:hypothetical protein
MRFYQLHGVLKMKNKKPNGQIIFKGPSELDGAPIVVIAITRSSNSKTGDMVQTYILTNNGKRPTINQQTGADVSICGDCKQRPINGGACYVVTAQGPSMVYKSFLNGNYTDGGGLREASKLSAGRMVRLGTYGDPSAVPSMVWEKLLKNAKGRTGYTHQWNNPAIDESEREFLKNHCMASVDNQAEYLEAKNQGWRTFRVRLAIDPLNKKESICPASIEAGKKLTCVDCGACDGGQKRHGDIAIINHGFKSKRYEIQRELIPA